MREVSGASRQRQRRSTIDLEVMLVKGDSGIDPDVVKARDTEESPGFHFSHLINALNCVFMYAPLSIHRYGSGEELRQ